MDIKPFPRVLSVQANGLGTVRTLLTRTRGRKGSLSSLKERVQNIFIMGRTGITSFLKENVAPVWGRLQAGGEVVLKEIPFPMWPQSLG